MTWRLARSPPFPPFAGYILKAVFIFTFSRLVLPVFGFSVGLTLGHWIGASGQLFASGKVALPDLCESHNGILPQCHQLFLTVKTIAPAPQLRSAGIDQQEQAIAVVLLDWFVARLHGS